MVNVRQLAGFTNWLLGLTALAGKELYIEGLILIVCGLILMSDGGD